MESLILKATNNVKHVSQKKGKCRKHSHEIKRSSATNLDKDTLQVEIHEMIIKCLTDENYKDLDKDILHLTKEPPVDEVHLHLIMILKRIRLVIFFSLVLRKPHLATLKRIWEIAFR